MFATVGIAVLLVLRGVRPQELYVALQPLPLVPLAFALALFGLAIDLKLRKSQLVAAPQLAWALLFVACAIGDLALTRPPGARAAAYDVAAGFGLYFLVAQGVQTFRSLAVVAATLVLLAVGAAAVALLPPSSLGAALGDPDTLALSLAPAVPLAFALWERKHSATRGFLSILALLLVGLCVISTRSRPGQVAYAAVLLVSFASRWRLRGLLFAALLSLPLFLFGARAAAPSARWGVGGPLGLLAVAAVLFLSFKIAVVLRRRYEGDREAAAARTWALALLAALAGVAAGLLFAPPGHGAVFWIYTGLAGALWQAAHAHDPQLGAVLIRRSRE